MESFSREQLLGYIKKQKLRIKQLEAETETLNRVNNDLKVNSISVSDNCAAKDIHSTDKCTTIESLTSINVHQLPSNNYNPKQYFKLIETLSLKSDQQQKLSNIKIIFYKWKIQHLMSKIGKLEQDQEQKNEIAKETIAKSEIKINKLKALLARTHHSKQVRYL